MTNEIAWVLGILVVSLVLFVSGRVRMDLVALLVLSTLAITGLVTPAEALSGFSNPAVITVWAMFILSAGMTHAGIADIIGRQMLRVAGRSETRVIVVLMLTGGVMSGIMNNIAVAAMLLPVAVGIAQRTGIAPSRLLLPLAYGTLLGGLTTLIGTPPNLLVSTALRDAGLRPFGFFDFTPVGAVILITGTAFVALVGRHLLPQADPLEQSRAGPDLRSQYSLQERIFALRVPADAFVVGKRLSETGLDTAAGLIVIALTRGGQTFALPDRNKVVQAGDRLLVQGRLDRFNTLRQWNELVIEREAPDLQAALWQEVQLRELGIAEESSLVGEPLRHQAFRETHGANVLAVIGSNGQVRRTRLSEVRLGAGDRLLIQCGSEALADLEKSPEFDGIAEVTEEALARTWKLQERLFVVHVPRDSTLDGVTVRDSRLGDAFDFRLGAVFRAGTLIPMPDPDELLAAGDLLLIQGREEDLDVLRGLQQLEIEEDATPYLGVFEEGELELVEASLHPHGKLFGKSVAELSLREQRQIELIALWRNGHPYRSGLGAMILQPGDALLLAGPKPKLAALNSDPDLIILNPVSAPVVDTSKAPLAAMLMLVVIGSVVAGWLPISIAAVAGAALMVLLRVLDMEQAYRAIDWRSIFLIAGMLPLGIAMQHTGAAVYLAETPMALLGQFGPWAVIAGLYAVTALATMIIPTAALVVLMAPIALSASSELGISPHTAMMAVAIAASASFASPVSHPANVLMMGPGGYRFTDYLKLGVPLTLVVFLVAALLLPLVWPL